MTTIIDYLGVVGDQHLPLSIRVCVCVRVDKFALNKFQRPGTVFVFSFFKAISRLNSWLVAADIFFSCSAFFFFCCLCF